MNNPILMVDPDGMAADTIRMEEILINVPQREPVQGIWGNIVHVWNGGNYDGFQYDRQGKPLGFSPAMGIAPAPGTAKADPRDVLKLVNSVKNFLTAAKGGATVLKGAAKSNYSRFVKKIPANSKSSATFKQLKDGNYLFEATSPGKVRGPKAVYQKRVNPKGETYKMIRTTYAPDGSITHVKSKF